MVQSMLLGTLIDRRGLKRSWLADQMAVSRSTLTRWAQGKLTPPVERVQELHRLTGIPLPDLLTAIEQDKRVLSLSRQRNGS